MEQIDLGEYLKQEGMSRAALSKKELLAYARELAKNIAECLLCKTCSINDVNRELEKQGYPPLGKAAGSVFITKDWEFTGKYVKSTKASNHARETKLWKLNRYG